MLFFLETLTTKIEDGIVYGAGDNYDGTKGEMYLHLQPLTFFFRETGMVGIGRPEQRGILPTKLDYLEGVHAVFVACGVGGTSLAIDGIKYLKTQEQKYKNT